MQNLDGKLIVPYKGVDTRIEGGMLVKSSPLLKQGCTLTRWRTNAKEPDQPS